MSIESQLYAWSCLRLNKDKYVPATYSFYRSHGIYIRKYTWMPPSLDSSRTFVLRSRHNTDFDSITILKRLYRIHQSTYSVKIILWKRFSSAQILGIVNFKRVIHDEYQRHKRVPSPFITWTMLNNLPNYGPTGRTRQCGTKIKAWLASWSQSFPILDYSQPHWAPKNTKRALNFSFRIVYHSHRPWWLLLVHLWRFLC